MAAPRKTTVLYILSSPHSASTALGVILAGHPEVFYGGELWEIPVPAWEPGRNCSCGVLAPECPFWGAVRARAEVGAGTAELRKGNRQFDGWSAVPRLLVAPSAEAVRYSESLRDFVAAIATERGKPIVIDTSKTASRGIAYTLARSDAFDVRFLHLLRDGRGVIASRKSSEARNSPTGTLRPHATFRFSLRWVFANLAYVVLFSRGKNRALRLRYEDLARDPATSLRRIGQLLDLDMTPVISRLAEGHGFPIDHVVAGNRLRLQGELRLRPAGTEWRERLTRKEQSLYRWVAGVTARLFGYT